MGWTGTHATHYKNGKVDRKAECDAYFTEGSNEGFYRLEKSALVGSVYYAAVTQLKTITGTDAEGNSIVKDIPESEQHTRAEIFLTSIYNKDYFNFLYKDMSESMLPGEYKCPLSILKLLSPTDNKYALTWRENCKKYHMEKKKPDSLKNLPIGAVIRFMRGEQVIELKKHSPAYQFKRPFWYCAENNSYIPQTRIPSDYEVVNM